MGLDNVSLRKLMFLFELKPNLRETQIKANAHQEMKIKDEGPSSGGDFHVPFWAAAKAHASGKSDLNSDIEELISKNWRRKKLYPLLKTGFLQWWNEKRRWINEKISELPKVVKASYGFHDIEGKVKVDNLLCLRLGDDKERLVYPYFSEKPPLSVETARLGLWLMSVALPDHNISDMRILDVLRAESYSIDKTPLLGNEEEVFKLRYRSILKSWRNYLQ